MFRKMPFILLSIIIFISIFSPIIPLPLQSLLYAVSLSVKSVIIFILPFVIFGLMFKTAVQLSKGASIFIIVLLAAICVSNFFSTMTSYFVGSGLYSFNLSMALPETSKELLPSFSFSLPSLLANDKAMLLGVLFGFTLSKYRYGWAEKISSFLEGAIGTILKGFLTIIPVFITGFIIKMSHDKILFLIVKNYSLIFGIVALSLLCYIGLLYLFFNRLQKTSFLESVKNILPAAFVGFGSMSSAAAMPLTLLAVEKNTKYNPALAKSMIPATVSTHLIGDCFAIPIFAFAVLKTFGAAEPSFLAYLIFALYFVAAKFSIAAVPGGGILVMLPILESYLGFNSSMLSLITALYILFDPVITCANIIGNGGFAALVSHLFTRAQTKKEIS